MLSPYEEEYKDDENVTVSFNKTVTLEDGIYFNDSFEDDNSIEDLISGVRQQEQTYTVQTGDTLWSIAQKNDLTFRELCALNTNFKGAPLTETSNIQEGDTLIVTKEEATLEVRITKVDTTYVLIPREFHQCVDFLNTEVKVDFHPNIKSGLCAKEYSVFNATAPEK